MNRNQQKIAKSLRKQWDYYHAEAMVCHMSGLEAAAVIIADQFAASDAKFKRAAFLALSIKR